METLRLANDFTKEELDIICHSLRLRESRMLADSELYKAQRNLEAQKDCLDEWRKTHKLHEKIGALAQSLK
jgi:hypothetical protein